MTFRELLEKLSEIDRLEITLEEQRNNKHYHPEQDEIFLNALLDEEIN